MPLDLTNLQSAIQSRVDALGASSDEKTLLLLSKAIEAAIGNVTVSEINNAAADGVSDIEAKRVLEVQAILDAAAAKIAQINGLDALLKTGGTATGDITAPNLFAASHVAQGVNPLHSWNETDAPANTGRWDAIALAGVLTFRAVNDVYGAVKNWMEIGRTAVSAVWVRFTTAVRAQVVPLTDGPSILVDFNAGNVFSVTLGGNRTLANPSNIPSDHQGGSIIIRQDGSGNRTLSFGNAWKFPFGTVPTLSTGANKVDRLFYTVVSPTEIHGALQKDFR